MAVSGEWRSDVPAGLTQGIHFEKQPQHEAIIITLTYFFNTGTLYDPFSGCRAWMLQKIKNEVLAILQDRREDRLHAHHVRACDEQKSMRPRHKVYKLIPKRFIDSHTVRGN